MCFLREASGQFCDTVAASSSPVPAAIRVVRLLFPQTLRDILSAHRQFQFLFPWQKPRLWPFSLQVSKVLTIVEQFPPWQRGTCWGSVSAALDPAGPSFWFCPQSNVKVLQSMTLLWCYSVGLKLNTSDVLQPFNVCSWADGEARLLDCTTSQAPFYCNKKKDMGRASSEH